MDIPDKIANLINEWPEHVKRLDTPSQVFSQALLKNGDWSAVGLDEALQRVYDYAQIAGVDPLLAKEAAEYTRQVWERFHGPKDIDPPPAPDSFSDRGF